tara:strand:- start:3030 stop:4469 length:1440 start_codon:yes stop_codon:yes gene_type:complete
MSAIITENFRRNNAALFLNDITTPSAPPTSEYYLGIGKQDKWVDDESVSGFTVPVAIGSRADELEVLSNLSTLVALNSLEGAVGRVIPAVSYRYNFVYKAYSSYDSSCFYPTGIVQPCYVTIQGAIFMCLKAGAGDSTSAPSIQTEIYAPFQLGDNYVWVLIQQASASPIIRTNTFTDVSTTALINDSPATDLDDSTDQCGGLVSGFTVVSGGTGYTGSSVFKLRRNDGFDNTGIYFNTYAGAVDDIGEQIDNLTLTATISGGSVTAVSYSGNVGTWLKGAVFASVEETADIGTGAVIIPTIAPAEGFAYIPAKVMPSWFAGLAVKLNDNLEGDSFYSRYRQISIIKNPTTEAGEEESTTLNALKYFTFDDVTTLPASLNIDSSIITDVSGNVIGFADHVINTTGNKKIYFHQNSVSGYRELPSTGSIKIDGGTSLPYTAINTGEFVNDGKAEVLFTENRSFITRTAGQLEDLILIIQF